MQRVLLILVLCFMGMGRMAHSETSSQTCGVLNTLAELPAALADASRERADAQAFRAHLAKAERGLLSLQTVLASDPEDAAALWAVVHQVEHAWGARQATSHGMTEFTLSRDHHDQMVGIFEKYGCHAGLLHGRTLVFGFMPIAFVYAFAAFMGLGIVLSVAGFVRLTRQRRAARFVCHLPAVLVQDGHRHATIVVDIGRGGAKVKTPGSLYDFHEVRLQIGDMDLDADVRWSNPAYTGLKFARVLGEHDVQALLELSSVAARVCRRSRTDPTQGEATRGTHQPQEARL